MIHDLHEAEGGARQSLKVAKAKSRSSRPGLLTSATSWLPTVALTAINVLFSTGVALADLGQVRLSEAAGEYHITVLTPTPLYQGTVPISVFVQAAKSREPIDNATVELFFRRRTDDSIHRSMATVNAVRDQDTAGPHFVARPYLGEPGQWQIDIAIDSHSHRQTVSFACDVAAIPPRWLTMWPWLSWPPVVILLFMLREYTRSHGRATNRPEPPTSSESREP